MLKTESKPRMDVDGKPFPCPLCGMALPVRMSQKQKPYCVCNDCGIQVFFRGRAGIQRLQTLLKSARPVSEDFSQGTFVVTLYNRLEELRKQREELEAKQGIIFRNETLDDAIAALDGEIKRIETEISKIRKSAERKK
jgi:hypothetical protein